jgi:hypothetical protein
VINLPRSFLAPGKNYECAIDRFALDGSSLPIFIFENNTYYVTLTYSTYVGQAVVTFSSVIDTGPNQLISNGVFSYQEFALQINAALTSAFTILNGPTQANGALNATAAPFLVFDTTKQTYTLWADSAFYDEELSTPIKVFFNNNLYFMFNNFLVESVSEYNINHQDYRIAIRDMGGNTNTQNIGGVETFTTVNGTGGSTTTKSIVGGVTYFLMSQEYPNLGTMQSVQKISVISRNLGIIPELNTLANTTNNLVNTNWGGSTIPFDNVIGDFIGVFGDNGSQWRSIIVYNPLYRRWHTRGTSSTSDQIDVTAQWSDAQNNTYDFYIESGKSMSCKFVFKEIKTIKY